MIPSKNWVNFVLKQDIEDAPGKRDGVQLWHFSFAERNLTKVNGPER